MKEGREKERSENKNWIKVYLKNIYYVLLLLIKGIDCSENKSTDRNKIISVLFLPCFEHKTQSSHISFPSVVVAPNGHGMMSPVCGVTQCHQGTQ